MKIKLRFGIHFVAGLLIWLLSMGLSMMGTIEFVFPLLGMADGDPYYDFWVFLVFLVHIIACSLIFGWYFASPLSFIMEWVSNLSQGVYSPPALKRSIFTKSHKLRKPYQLYDEVISNINALSDTLEQAKQDRHRLEEAKKEWIAGISHDLKTPLTYITGYSTLLLNEEYTWSEEEKRSFLHEIQKKGQHLEALIQDLNVSIQMIDTQGPVPLNPKEANLIVFLKNLLADTWNDPRAFSYELQFLSEEECLSFVFDERLMYRALQNLLMNSILHNPPGTAIEVSLRKESNQSILITISDNGIGMDQETLNNLFQKYYRGTTTNSSEFGTGLGMAIAKSLIHAHGGQILVESTPGGGTTFTILLPSSETAYFK
ncbi:HAMP domain-containing sensor histidine kinase [Paenibacillus filicis]|uniref:histidine kinase n=1 Tax=Paenibacillus filicis TaxID=669464 RepID=A0ABU9DFS3_9BACL